MQKNRVMLVADDIDVNRASFRAMFEEEYEVLEAGSLSAIKRNKR